MICLGSEEERVVQETTLSMRVRVPEGNVTNGQSSGYYYQLGTNVIFWYTFCMRAINILYLQKIFLLS